MKRRPLASLLLAGALTLSLAAPAFAGTAAHMGQPVRWQAYSTLDDTGLMTTWDFVSWDGTTFGTGFSMANAVSIAQGDVDTWAAITEDGSLYTWGVNYYGTLGNGYRGDDEDFRMNCPRQTYPMKIMDDVAAVSVDNQNTAILKKDGSVWCCGLNEWGGVGVPREGCPVLNGMPYVPTPVKVIDGGVKAIASSPNGVMAAIKEDNSLWMWGNNCSYSIGNGRRIYIGEPTRILEDVADVSIGFRTVHAIRTDGTLWGWGDNQEGQVGIGSTSRYVAEPTYIMDDVISVHSDRFSTIAARSDGSVWVWGSNYSDRLGAKEEDVPQRLTPTQIPGAQGAVRVQMISLQQVLFQKADGTIWSVNADSNAWGDRAPVPHQILPEAAPIASWARPFYDRGFREELVTPWFTRNVTENATRADFCELAVRFYEKLTGKPIEGRKDFSDVPQFSSEFNATAVRKLASLGVVSGVGDGKFDPLAPLNREQAATMLANLMKALGRPLPQAEAAFADSGSVSGWAAGAVGQMQASGVMNGLGDNRFGPKEPYTRQQSVITICHLLDLVQ